MQQLRWNRPPIWIEQWTKLITEILPICKMFENNMKAANWIVTRSIYLFDWKYALVEINTVLVSLVRLLFLLSHVSRGPTLKLSYEESNEQFKRYINTELCIWQ